MKIVQVKNLNGKMGYAIRKRRWLLPDIFLDLKSGGQYWWPRSGRYYKDCISADLKEAARLAKKNPDNRFAVFSPVISYICQMPEPTETIHL